MIDNYDSFTYNLLDYLRQLGQDCRVIRNNEESLETLSQKDFNGVVISPGPKTPLEAGITMDLIKHWHQEVPILGICLGHQALGMCFGAELYRAKKPVHGKTSRITHIDHPLFEGIDKELDVMRYHSLLIKPSDNFAFQLIATSSDGEVMAMAHPVLPLAGVQFHPESGLTPCGLRLLKNWLRWTHGR